MDKKSEYICLISQRGDRYGGHGGTHDLLLWCGKRNLQEVTEEEARLFYKDPKVPYKQLTN